MSGLENMKARIQYAGGQPQVDRMNKDKLRSLKKALLYSYQSATAILNDGREFRCLINPDMLKNQYDNKIISIPFKDICLNEEKKGKTSEGIQEIGMKCGDVFTWKENGTDWLVYLRRLEETAYFRAEIRRCKYSVNIDNKEYKCYAARPSVNEIDWMRQKNKLWNDIDYTLEMYITKDEKTEAFFHRFAIINVNNKPWEVQAIDSMSSDGIIIIALKEWYQNTIEEQRQEEIKEEEKEKQDNLYIEGPTSVLPYLTYEYNIRGLEDGVWKIGIGSQKVKILTQDNKKIKLEIITGRSGKFELQYVIDDQVFALEVIIESL